MELRRLDEQLAELLAMVEGWSENRFAFRPSATEWSAAQVFDHLEKTERQILAAAKTGLKHPHDIGVRDRLGNIFLNKVFASERKVKVPGSAKAIFPDDSPSIPEVLACWRETRNAICSFYTPLTPEQHTAGIFRHPVGGWMNAEGVLGFFSVHMRHHAYQLARIQTASAHVPHS